MANIPLQSITFPGLSDKYTTPTVDATLTQTGAAADAKKTGDEISGLKNDFTQFPSGNYPEMGAGYANQLVSGLKKEDQTPYNFRKVPYDATLEEVKKIVGGTIAWNQLVNKDKFLSSRTLSGIPYTNNGDGSITLQVTEVPSATISIAITANHSASYFNVPYNHKFIIYDRNSKPAGIEYQNSYNGHSLGWNSVKNQEQANGYLLLGMNINTEAIVGTYTLEPQITDLTQDFGTAIADYVYNLEQATAGAGIAWLKTHFPKQFDAGYQAYDAGSLQSVSGLTEHKMVGFNQWDEEWKVVGDHIGSKNPIPCLPNTAYYMKTNYQPSNGLKFWTADMVQTGSTRYNGGLFTTPSDCCFMTFEITNSYGTTYKNDICINLSDPTKNGTYEPYEAHSYALDSDVVLRGIPKVDASGNLYYDGDEYLPDGTVNRRWGVYTCTGQETLTTQQEKTNNKWISFDLPNAKLLSNVFSADFKTDMGVTYSDNINNDVAYGAFRRNTLFYVSFPISMTTSEMQAWIAGKTILYELATPTTETADPYTGTQIVAPDGTEEYIYENGAFELPVGHSSDYPIDVSGQLDDILDTPSANGTYVLKATVTDGAVTYSWVADA